MSSLLVVRFLCVLLLLWSLKYQVNFFFLIIEPVPGDGIPWGRYRGEPGPQEDSHHTSRPTRGVLVSLSNNLVPVFYSILLEPPLSRQKNSLEYCWIGIVSFISPSVLPRKLGKLYNRTWKRTKTVSHMFIHVHRSVLTLYYYYNVELSHHWNNIFTARPLEDSIWSHGIRTIGTVSIYSTDLTA